MPKCVMLRVFLEEQFDPEELLKAWGGWSRQSGAKLGYRSFASLLGMGGGKSPRFSFSPEDLEYIDRALCEMKGENPEMFQYILLRYSAGVRTKDIAKRVKMRYQDCIYEIKNAVRAFSNILIRLWAEEHRLPPEWMEERVMTVTNLK